MVLSMKLEIISKVMLISRLIISNQISTALETMVLKMFITTRFMVPIIKSIKSILLLLMSTIILLADTTCLLITWSTTIHGRLTLNGKLTKVLFPKAILICSIDRDLSFRIIKLHLLLELMMLITDITSSFFNIKTYNTKIQRLIQQLLVSKPNSRRCKMRKLNMHKFKLSWTTLDHKKDSGNRLCQFCKNTAWTKHQKVLILSSTEPLCSINKTQVCLHNSCNSTNLWEFIAKLKTLSMTQTRRKVLDTSLQQEINIEHMSTYRLICETYLKVQPTQEIKIKNQVYNANSSSFISFIFHRFI